MNGRIPVILDTDIGTDIDDTWAVAMMLNSPELDVKLITTAGGDTTYRAKIIAKLLEAADRRDIPIGIGPATSCEVGAQEPWVRGYALNDYHGFIFEDGVAAMCDVILNSDKPVTLISIGPLMNVAAALDRQPEITCHARFVGMHGSIYKGYCGSVKPIAEYNVAMDATACRRVFSAPWQVTITPLDTCGLVKLTGEKYSRVQRSASPLVRALIENYHIWDSIYNGEKFSAGYAVESTILYDAVAVYLAFAEDLLEIRELGVSVMDGGTTVVDSNAREIRCALGWKDLGKFEDLLAERLA